MIQGYIASDGRAGHDAVPEASRIGKLAAQDKENHDSGPRHPRNEFAGGKFFKH
jgi:hypothetical protein